MALAVAMVACQGAAGTDGKDAPGVAPQTVNGGIPDAEVDVGESKRMDVSEYFNDPDGDNAKITYSRATSAAEFATATISGKTLTVMGIKEGMATITVTATDAQGLTAKSPFKVTVNPMPDPDPDPDPDPGTTLEDVPSEISVGSDPEEVTLPADHTLDPGDDGVVTVMRKSMEAATSSRWTAADSMTDNVWVIIAVKMGSTTVEVLDADGNSVKDIAVTVTVNMVPTKTGIEAQPIRIGDPLSINLNMYFSDPEGGILEYDVLSDDDAVMATEADGTLNLEAKSAGTATITVDATDDAGNMATDMFMVTVEIGCPPTMDFDIGDIESCDLQSGYSIYNPKEAIARVVKVRGAAANTWSVEALKKGSVTLAIQNEKFATVDEIEVTVKNPSPTRNTKANPSGSTLIDDGSAVGLKLYKLGGNLDGEGLLSTYFDDDDLSGLKFKAVAPPGILVKLKDGAVVNTATAPAWNFRLEILNFPKTNTFDIQFYAVDDADQESDRPVVFTFVTGAVTTISTTVRTGLAGYTIAQYESGDFDKTKIEIGNRLGVQHVFTFAAFDLTVDAADVGFRFAHKLIEKYEASDTKAGKLFTKPAPTDSYHVDELELVDSPDISGDPTAMPYKMPDNTPADDADENARAGVDYWKIEATGAIEVGEAPITDEAGALVAEGPETDDLFLTVTPVRTGMGKITISYYVWIAKSAALATVTGITENTRGGMWVMDKRELNVDVKACDDFDECGKL